MTSENPYVASAELGAEIANPDQSKPAKQWKRLVTWIIDVMVLNVFNFGVEIVFGMAQTNPNVTEEDLFRQAVWGWIIAMVACMLYYIAMEATLGQTIGKMVCGTRVIGQDGGKPSLGQIVGRTLCRFIPFEPISLLIGDSKRPTAWHDSIPKTRVTDR